MTHDSTRPPPVDQRATHHDPEETPVETADRIAREGRALARELAANQGTLDNRVEALELLVGRAPSALPGDRGSGLAQHFVDLGAAVTTLTKRLGDTIAALDADRTARTAEETRRATELDKRREPWSRAGWVVLGSAIAVVVGGIGTMAIQWIVTLHH